MKATIDYIKYSIYDTYAVVNGYDQRKKEERVIRIPSKIHYNGRLYPIKGVASYPDGGFKTKVVEIPNTITSVGFQTIDITENVGEEHTYPNGITVRIYEAREGYKPVIMQPLKKNTTEQENRTQGFIVSVLAFLKKIFESKPKTKEEIKEKRDLNKETLNEGALPGVFTLKDGRKIRFSKGNLQFHPLNNIFRFAEQQYETLGKEANEKCSPTLDGWIDLFCWGASGYKGYSPTENNIEIPHNPNKPNNDIIGNNVNYDWGVFNPISNGGNQEGLWRTLLAEEWNYLVKDRPNAENLKLTCTLCERKGFVLLPDDFWSNCSHLNTAIDITNSKPFSILFDSEQWKQLESLGAVFFPESEVVLLTMDFTKYLNNEPIYHRRYWGTKIAFFTATKELFKACIDGAADRYVNREKYPVRLIQDVK